MPLASHRLDLLLVPVEPEEQRDIAPLAALGEAQGWWTGTAPGPHANRLGVGLFAAVRGEVSQKPRLYANGLGGFRVQCGACDAPAARALGRSMALGRGLGVPEVRCDACGVRASAAALTYAPPAAFACAAWTLVDVASAHLDPEASARITHAWGAWRLIARRVA